jgi:hypothetical protein
VARDHHYRRLSPDRHQVPVQRKAVHPGQAHVCQHAKGRENSALARSSSAVA